MLRPPPSTHAHTHARTFTCARTRRPPPSRDQPSCSGRTAPLSGPQKNCLPCRLSDPGRPPNSCLGIYLISLKKRRLSLDLVLYTVKNIAGSIYSPCSSQGAPLYPSQILPLPLPPLLIKSVFPQALASTINKTVVYSFEYIWATEQSCSNHFILPLQTQPLHSHHKLNRILSTLPLHQKQHCC